MATTPLMNLDLPTPSVTLGPTWANDINTALETIDSHDHSTGKGTKIKTSGLSINADLTYNNFGLLDVKSVECVDLDATLTGLTNANKVYVVSGDLYFTNDAGTAVQLTSGGAVVSAPASFSAYDRVDISSNLNISAAATVTLYTVDTTAGRTITLPLASAVADGRTYKFKDKSGQADANPFTINVSGSDTIDGASSVTVNGKYESIELVGDGTSAWFIV